MQYDGIPEKYKHLSNDPLMKRFNVLKCQEMMDPDTGLFKSEYADLMLIKPRLCFVTGHLNILRKMKSEGGFDERQLDIMIQVKHKELVTMLQEIVYENEAELETSSCTNP